MVKDRTELSRFGAYLRGMIVGRGIEAGLNGKRMETMCIAKEAWADAQGVRVELIDHWHRDWDRVLARVEGLGQRQQIGVDADGWLPARQNLLAAFVEGQPAGHLCFRVEPVCRDGHVVVDRGRPMVAAQVEAVDVYPGFSDGDVRQLLKDAAVRRALDLRCREVRGRESN